MSVQLYFPTTTFLTKSQPYEYIKIWTYYCRSCCFQTKVDVSTKRVAHFKFEFIKAFMGWSLGDLKYRPPLISILSHLSQASIQQVFYSNEHGASWRNVHLLSPWSLEGGQDENYHSGVSSHLGWWASAWPSGEKARVAVHCMVLTWLRKKSHYAFTTTRSFCAAVPLVELMSEMVCEALPS